MGLLDGKKGLVFGVANDRSIAWHTARHLIDQGAVCGFAHLPGEKMERRVRRTLMGGGVEGAWIHPCDVSSDDDLDALFAAAKTQFSTIDFLVHSLAFADRQFLQHGRFAETTREAQALMPDGGAILAMTYYGSQKVVPGYNVMGVAKAALECAGRYLAAELGAKKIRVNCISAGPLRTLSSMAVGGIDDMFNWTEQKAPLRRNIDAGEVGATAVYLLSDLSSAVTGTTLYVDAGYNIMG